MGKLKFYLVCCNAVQVYKNSFIGADAAAISVRVLPQGMLCGNACEDGPCDITKYVPPLLASSNISQVHLIKIF